MPRAARIKNNSGIYHIMVRSISEINLFQTNEDKERYLSIIRRYQKIYTFKIYAYCLMTNHGHFIIDSAGCDISKFMQSINLSFSLYFNKKYNRHGHLFQDRFKSRLIKDNKDLIATSSYIHNNPKDIKKYSSNPFKYPYSSMNNYINFNSLSTIEVDIFFLLNILSEDLELARIHYIQLVNKNLENPPEQYSYKNEKSDYRSEKKVLERNINIDIILKFLESYFPQSYNIYIKRNSSIIEYKALLFILLRSFSNYKLKDICHLVGNITLSSVSKTYLHGINLIHTNPKYNDLIEKFISYCI